MDEQLLGLQMLEFEREQVKLEMRPPLPCDGKLITQKYKCLDRIEDVFWHIKRYHGLTTGELFDLVNFSHCDFTFALQTLVERGRVEVGQRGRAMTYKPARRK